MKNKILKELDKEINYFLKKNNLTGTEFIIPIEVLKNKLLIMSNCGAIDELNKLKERFDTCDNTIYDHIDVCEIECTIKNRLEELKKELKKRKRVK